MSADAYTYADHEPAVRDALARGFPKAVADTHEGYLGRVHALVVSADFNGTSDGYRQERGWEVLRAELAPEHLAAVSVVMAVAPEELW